MSAAGGLMGVGVATVGVGQRLVGVFGCTVTLRPERCAVAGIGGELGGGGGWG